MSAGCPGYRAPTLWLLIPYMAGLAAGRMFSVSPVILIALATATAAAAIPLAWSVQPIAHRLWCPTIAVTIALAGMAYFQLRLNRLSAWETLPPREARLRLRVERTFASSAGGHRATGFATVTGTDLHLRDLTDQRLYFSLNLPLGTPPPLRSTEVAATGLLEPLIRRGPSDGFQGYIMDAGMTFKFTRGRVMAEVSPPSRYRQFCHQAEQRFHAILGTGLADQPSLAAILRAMMMGQKQEMSDEQQGLFMHSGTMHLFAISGLNITAIALSVQILLSLLRVPRLAAAAVGLATLWMFVDITGGSSSAVRAFLMCTLFIASFSLRQPGNALAALAASALLILLIEPMQLFSASFQMSYGIVAALVLLGAPLAERMLQAWPLFSDLPKVSWCWYHHLVEFAWRTLLGLVAVGLASSLISAVATIQFFRLFTPGSLVINLLLIPVSTLVIGAGFLSLLCGLPGFAAGSVLFNHAGALLLWGMDALLRIAMAVPGIYRSAQFRLPWIGPAFFAVLLIVCLAGYAWNWRRERGGFWPPFVLVAILLICGVRYGA